MGSFRPTDLRASQSICHSHLISAVSSRRIFHWAWGRWIVLVPWWESGAVFRRTFEFRDFLDHALTQFVFRISGLWIDCAGSGTGLSMVDLRCKRWWLQIYSNFELRRIQPHHKYFPLYIGGKEAWRPFFLTPKSPQGQAQRLFHNNFPSPTSLTFPFPFIQGRGYGTQVMREKVGKRCLTVHHPSRDWLIFIANLSPSSLFVYYSF